jgi:hypothetical protein
LVEEVIVSALVRVVLSQGELRIEPGQTGELLVTMQNLSEIVDQYSIEIDGLDASWYCVPISEVSLFPQDQERARISLHPPSGSEAEAGKYDFMVRVVSRENPTERTSVPATLEVLPRLALEVGLSPERATSTGDGVFQVRLVNPSNVDLTVDLSAADPEEGCTYRFEPGRVSLGAGESRGVTLTVSPKSRPPRGEARRYDFTVRAEPTAGGMRGQAVMGSLEHRSAMPKWALPAAIVAALLLCCGVASVAGFALFGEEVRELAGGLRGPTPTSWEVVYATQTADAVAAGMALAAAQAAQAEAFAATQTAVAGANAATQTAAAKSMAATQTAQAVAAQAAAATQAAETEAIAATQTAVAGQNAATQTAVALQASAAPPTSMPTSVPTPTRAPRPTLTPEPTAPLPIVVFEDGFDGGAIDLAKWEIESTGHEVAVSDGILQLASSASRYPYVHARSSIFPSDGAFRLTFRVRYAKVDVCGVGVLMTSSLIPGGLGQEEAADRQKEAEQSGVAAGIWQDSTGGMQMWFRSGADRADIPISGPDTAWHHVVIEYLANQYNIHLDGDLVYGSQRTPQRARFVWMGHPSDLGSPCAWGTLEVDFVRVESLP